MFAVWENTRLNDPDVREILKNLRKFSGERVFGTSDLPKMGALSRIREKVYRVVGQNKISHDIINSIPRHRVRFFPQSVYSFDNPIEFFILPTKNASPNLKKIEQDKILMLKLILGSDIIELTPDQENVVAAQIEKVIVLENKMHRLSTRANKLMKEIIKLGGGDNEELFNRTRQERTESIETLDNLTQELQNLYLDLNEELLYKSIIKELERENVRNI